MNKVQKENLSKIPKTPGVYFLKNSRGAVLYIGKAINLKNRVKNHFGQPTYWNKFFIKNVSKIGYIKTNSNIGALLLESQLIKKYKPRYNIMLRDDKQYFYVCFTKNKLPMIYTTHQPKPSGSDPDGLGPFTDGKSLKIVLRYLRKPFPYYTQKHRKLPCPYCHIGLCPGPNPNATDYKKNIAKIRAILRGQKPRVISSLKKEMKRASKKFEYERAAKIKSQIEALENIFSHYVMRGGERIFDEKGVSEAKPRRRASLPTGQAGFCKSACPVPSEGLVWGGRNPKSARLAGASDPVLSSKYPFSSKKNSSIEACDVSNIQGHEPTASMVRFENGRPNKTMYRRFKIRLPEKPNDVSMIREVVRRRLAHPEWHYPDLFLIDGGRGQLNAALRQCQMSNVKCQIAALAKRFNELYLPDRKKPIPLDSLPENVKHTLMYARDEAHRFAISYHRKLHRKRIVV